jgi:hypothetical protein
VTTTAQGSELARRFRVALREIEYGLEEVRAAQGMIVSRIAIGNIPHSATRVLSGAIDKLLAIYPKARVQVVDDHYEALLKDLRAGKLDLLFGVLRRPDWASDVHEERFFPILIARSYGAITHLPVFAASRCAIWRLTIGSCRPAACRGAKRSRGSLPVCRRRPGSASRAPRRRFISPFSHRATESRCFRGCKPNKPAIGCAPCSSSLSIPAPCRGWTVWPRGPIGSPHLFTVSLCSSCATKAQHEGGVRQ